MGIKEITPEERKKRADRLREWRKNNREHVKKYQEKWIEKHPLVWDRYKKSSSLKRMYGITLDEFEYILAEQGNRCAICGTLRDRIKSSLCVDHDHKTRKVRGILCNSCNILLSMAKDDTGLLTAAIEYLESGHWEREE